MTTFEAMALTRLAQWSASRSALLNGLGHPLNTSGWVERRARTFDARHVQVIDFERVFATLPDAEQKLLLLVYRDRAPMPEVAAALHCTVRSAHAALPIARQRLADALDRRHLL